MSTVSFFFWLTLVYFAFVVALVVHIVGCALAVVFCSLCLPQAVSRWQHFVYLVGNLFVVSFGVGLLLFATSCFFFFVFLVKLSSQWHPHLNMSKSTL